MPGGLRHQSDEKKRPSYLVGYKLADKASHPVKGTQCICAEASSVLELMKFITPNTLTGADVLRDVETCQPRLKGRHLDKCTNFGGGAQMRMRKEKLLWNVLLGTSVYLLDSLRARLAEGAEDLTD